MIHSVQIAPGPIEMSGSDGISSYDFNSFPVDCNLLVCKGRIEIWDSAGRMVYSRRTLAAPTYAAEFQGQSVSRQPNESSVIRSPSISLPPASPDKTFTESVLSNSKPARGNRGKEPVTGPKRISQAPEGDPSLVKKRRATETGSKKLIRHPKVKYHESSSDDFEATDAKSSSSESDQGHDTEEPSLSQFITDCQILSLCSMIFIIQKPDDAAPFCEPVGATNPETIDYLDIVKHPMDLGTMKEKLTLHHYSSVNACIADMEQIVENAVLYNGKSHPVAKLACKVKAAFDSQVQKLVERRTRASRYESRVALTAQV